MEYTRMKNNNSNNNYGNLYRSLVYTLRFYKFLLLLKKLTPIPCSQSKPLGFSSDIPQRLHTTPDITPDDVVKLFFIHHI